MRPLYRAGQRDTCTVRSQPVLIMKMTYYILLYANINFTTNTMGDGRLNGKFKRSKGHGGHLNLFQVDLNEKEIKGSQVNGIGK